MALITFCLLAMAAILALVGSVFAIAGFVTICVVCFRIFAWVAAVGLLLFVIEIFT